MQILIIEERPEGNAVHGYTNVPKEVAEAINTLLDACNRPYRNDTKENTIVPTVRKDALGFIDR